MATRPEHAATRIRPPLRVVAGGGRRRSSYIPVVFVVVMTLFGVAGLQAYLGQGGFEAAELEQRVTAAEERLALLRAEAARASSPERISAEAQRLGLVAPSMTTALEAPDRALVAQGPEADIGTTKRLIARAP